MSVIERTEQRLKEEERQNSMGAPNEYTLAYWAAYLDGARAQKQEITTFPHDREGDNG